MKGAQFLLLKSTNWIFYPLKRAISGAQIGPEETCQSAEGAWVCVGCSDRGRQMGHTALPRWVWSWSTANYILIKYDLSVPAPPHPRHTCACLCLDIRGRKNTVLTRPCLYRSHFTSVFVPLFPRNPKVTRTLLIPEGDGFVFSSQKIYNKQMFAGGLLRDSQIVTQTLDEDGGKQRLGDTFL